MASVITLRYPGTVVGDRDIDLVMSSIERELMQAAVCLRGFLWLASSRPPLGRRAAPRYPDTGNLHQLLEADWRIRKDRRRRDREDAKRALDGFASGRTPVGIGAIVKLLFSAFVAGVGRGGDGT